MKYIIQISLALIVALQLVQQLPGTALARDFPGADDIPVDPRNKTSKTDKDSKSDGKHHKKTDKEKEAERQAHKNKKDQKKEERDEKHHRNDEPDGLDSNTSNKHSKSKAEKAAEKAAKKEERHHEFDPMTDEYDERKFGRDKNHGGLSIYKPGVKVRLAQGLTQLMQKQLLTYIQTFYNFDYDWSESGEYKIHIFPIYTKFKYWDFECDPIALDPYKFSFNFTEMKIDGEPVVYMNIPLIHNWQMRFGYQYRIFGIPFKGKMEVHLNDVNALMTTSLKATSHGHLYPKLHDFRLDMGYSQIFTPHKLGQWFIRQFTNTARYMLEHALKMFGKGIINADLPKWSREYLNEQITYFPMEIPQLNKTGDFNLNWRLTADPVIAHQALDLNFFADIGPQQSHCTIQQDTHEYDFGDYDNRYIQLMISDRVVNCLFEAMERQNWFHYTLSSEYMIAHFGSHTFKINARLLMGAYPVVAELYGADQELEIEFKVKTPRVRFGNGDQDVGFHIRLDVGIKLAGDMNFLIYDEVIINSALDFSIENEIVYAEVHHVEVQKAGVPAERKLPIYNNMDLSEDLYAQFWNWAGEASALWQDYLNSVIFNNGVPLPYWNLELMTETFFRPHSLMMVIDLFYNDVNKGIKGAVNGNKNTDMFK